MRNLKYIPIILLSFILCESNTFAQKKKGSKSTKRATTRMMNRSPVISRSKSTETETETTTETPVIAEQQPEQVIDAAIINTPELDELQAQMQVLHNKILEKQDEYRNIDSKIEDINEAYMNLEQKQNKSKNSCEAISVKKMDEIKGWLIATVASSGVGTAANATATVTSFLQKDESQVDKKNEKSLERAKNKEIKELEKEQKSLSKNIKETNELLNNENLTQDEIDGLLDHNRQNNEDFTNITNNINNLKENPYTGEVKTTDYEKQAKTNKNLSTASKISSIVGTVASGTATITSAVATGLVASISQQVKKCKETF